MATLHAVVKRIKRLGVLSVFSFICFVFVLVRKGLDLNANVWYRFGQSLSRGNEPKFGIITTKMWLDSYQANFVLLFQTLC